MTINEDTIDPKYSKDSTESYPHPCSICKNETMFFDYEKDCWVCTFYSCHIIFDSQWGH